MSFLVRLLFVVSVVFTLTLAFVWVVDWVFGAEPDVALAEAERDLRDRLAVGPCEWLP